MLVAWVEVEGTVLKLSQENGTGGYGGVLFTPPSCCVSSSFVGVPLSRGNDSVPFYDGASEG